jgi:putative tributyrin esterase
MRVITDRDCTMRAVKLWRAWLAVLALVAGAAAPAAQDRASVPAAAPSPAAARATARTVRITSASLGNLEYAFAVLLPTGYDTSTKRYPVLFLLHGGGQTHTAFPSRGWFTRDAAAREMIVVLPNGGRSFFANAAGLQDARYEDLIARELVEYVDTHYRTVARRESRAIAGISMGGFGSALIALRHPDVFGTAGPLSAPLASARAEGDGSRLIFGAPGSDERRARDPLTLVTQLVPENAPYFYVACGLDDSLLGASRDFVRLLSARNLPHRYVEVPGGHTWAVWDEQLKAFFDLLATRPSWNQK